MGTALLDEADAVLLSQALDALLPRTCRKQNTATRCSFPNMLLLLDVSTLGIVFQLLPQELLPSPVLFVMWVDECFCLLAPSSGGETRCPATGQSQPQTSLDSRAGFLWPF